MNYPSGIIKKNNKNVNYANRGMALEEDINRSNEFYLLHDIAVIHKKPTPIQVNKVDYPSRYEAVIKEAYYKVPSTTDYNGIYKGKYLDFEAKETQNKTAFPLINIHKHQIEHLKSIIRHKGIGFIIVSFTKINRIFLLKGEDLINFIDNNSRKSIPLSYFLEKGYEMKYKINPRIDYLETLDIIYRGELNE